MSLSGSHKKTLLVRPPSHLLSSGVVTHIQDERNSVSYQLAQSQWNHYKQIFSQRGWEIKQIQKQDDCSDGVFVEDALVYFSKPLSGSEDKDKRGLIVLCQAGHPSRRPERTTVEATLRELKNGDNDNDFNNFDVEEIKSPGTLDGGDVLKIEKESVVYVGSGSRTNAEGIKQLRILLCKRGYSVVAVPMTKALHLSKLYLLKRHSYPLELFKFIEIDPSYSFCLATFYFFSFSTQSESAVTALPDGTIIGHPSLIDNISIFPRFIPIPHPHGVAVVVLSETEVLMSSSSKESCDLIQSLGYDVVRVGISEFEKLEGCVTCLSVRLRG